MNTAEYENRRSDYEHYYLLGTDAHLEKDADLNFLGYKLSIFGVVVGVLGLCGVLLMAATAREEELNLLYPLIAILLIAISVVSAAIYIDYSTSIQECSSHHMEKLRDWSQVHPEIRKYLQRLDGLEIYPRVYEYNKASCFVNSISPIEAERNEYLKAQKLMKEALGS